jgi:cell division protein FtsW
MIPFLQRTQSNILAKIFWQSDKTILAVMLALFTIGLVLVVSTSSFVAIKIGKEPTYFIYHHVVYLCLGISVFITLFFFTQEQIVNLAIFISIGAIALMIIILLFGVEVKGAKRWLYLFGFSVQPSEFVKVCFPVVFAWIYRFCKEKKFNLKIMYSLLFTYCLMIIVLLLNQPDVGMSMLILALFGLLLLLIGMQVLWFVILVFLGLIVVILLYLNISHVNYRVNSFFEGGSYQVLKSMDAIANGSFFGKGAGLGVIKEYLPDSHTDFIFSVGIEEFGLFFGLLIIGLYLTILYRAIKYVENSNNIFNMIVVMGCVFILLLQSGIHIASSLNLMPTKGMTLPLISYGGSSLVANFLLMGFLIFFSRKNLTDVKYKPLKF